MIEFKKTELSSTFMDASGSRIRRIQQVRTDPVTLRKCRITPSRALENERGTEMLYHPPETDLDEKKKKERYIGSTGSWEWIAAFAPSGFYEIWGIAQNASSIMIPEKIQTWTDLAKGVLNAQKFYKSLNRNSYNLAMLSVEDGKNFPCLKVSLTARSSYAPWVRSDFTGFEITSGEMATFTFPESVATAARGFWETG